MPYKKLTKFISTIGPSCEKENSIRKMISFGTNIFRFNLKHNDPKWHSEKMKLVNKVSGELNLDVGIMIDLQGTEIRITTYKEKDIKINKGDMVMFTAEFGRNTSLLVKYRISEDNQIKIPQSVITDSIKMNKHINLDDGNVELTVLSKVSNGFIAKSNGDYTIRDRVSMNVAGNNESLEKLITDEIDKISKSDLKLVDFFALSYTRTASDVISLRKVLDKKDSKAKIVGKIEDREGLNNIDEIVEVSDSIMIGRGDLGVEIPFEEITYYQKEIIKKCRNAAKPVIVATQMLESMINKPKPTRAEAADVSNAIFDGTDCLLLSAETAIGNYPIKAVEVLRKIAIFNESKADAIEFTPEVTDQSRSVVKAGVNMVKDRSFKVDKIVVFTETGYTARIVASFRPHIPVVALSEKENTVKSLCMSYGVIPIYYDFPAGDFKYPTEVSKLLKKRGLLKEGDTILVIHGKRWRDPGNTNSIVVLTV